MSTAILRPDAKGRITLGKLAIGISGFEINVEDPLRIVLTPLIEIPAREKWLFENPTTLKYVRQGLQEAKAGKVKSLGSFAKYANDDK